MELARTHHSARLGTGARLRTLALSTLSIPTLTQVYTPREKGYVVPLEMDASPLWLLSSRGRERYVIGGHMGAFDCVCGWRKGRETNGRCELIRPRAGRPPSQLPNFHRRIAGQSQSLIRLYSVSVSSQAALHHVPAHAQSHDDKPREPRPA